MTKNWICLALLIWAVVATLLLFRKEECNICDESSVIVKTKSASRAREPVSGGGGVTKVSMNATANNGRLINVSQSPEHRRISVAYQQSTEKHLVGYTSKVFNQESAYEKEGFTMIMLTYKRVMVLPKLLLHYCKAKSLRKILVIWNDVESQVPQDILDLANKCQVTLEFIQEKENKLTNRFKPRPEIETECK